MTKLATVVIPLCSGRRLVALCFLFAAQTSWPQAAPDTPTVASPASVAASGGSGWTPTIVYDGSIASNLRGGDRRGTAYIGNLHLRDLWSENASPNLAGGSAYVDLMWIHGGSPSRLVGDAQGVSNLSGPAGVLFKEAWVQRNFTEPAVSILAGLYDLNSEFYRLQAAGLFLNGSFGIGADMAQSGVEGPSIFPRTSVGLRLTYKPSDGVILRGALLDGVPLVRPDGAYGLFRRGDGVLAVMELATVERPAPAARSSTRDRLGRFSGLSPYVEKLAVGAWHYTGRYPSFASTVDPATGSSTDNDSIGTSRRGSSGAYMVGEAIVLEQKQERTQTVSAFAQFGVAQANVNRFKNYAGAGLVAQGFSGRRSGDQMGLSVASAQNGGPYRASIGPPAASRRAETTIEATYLTQLTPSLSIQPDLQYVRHPDTDPRLGNAWVFQLRFEASY